MLDISAKQARTLRRRGCEASLSFGERLLDGPVCVGGTAIVGCNRASECVDKYYERLHDDTNTHLIFEDPVHNRVTQMVIINRRELLANLSKQTILEPDACHEPKYWFILERRDEDGGRPPINDRDIEIWGNISIPIYDRSAFHPAYERPYMQGTPYYNNEATVTLLFASIKQAAIDAGRLPKETDYFPASLHSISLPQRLGRILLNEPYLDPAQHASDWQPTTEAYTSKS